MASFELTGTIHKIEPVTSRQSNDKTYKSQDIILSCPEVINGRNYDNYPKLTGKSYKVLQYMSSLKEGQHVTLHFNIKGFNGAKGNFTGLEIWKVEAGTQQPAQNQPQKNEGIPVYSSDHTTNGGSGFATGFNPSPETVDDLPF